MPSQCFQISTSRQREIVDITRQVQEAVGQLTSGDGLVCVSVAHCTCALYVNEYERGLIDDTLRLLEEMSSRSDWQHDRIDDNAAAHLAASVVGSSVTLPVAGGAVELGVWQRILLVELDGPRRRKVTVCVVPES